MEQAAKETVPDLIRANAGKSVLHFRGQAIPGALLLSKAGHLAAALARAGVARESRVAVLLERSPDTLAALLALWRLDAVYVPLDPRLPPARLALTAEACRPGFLLCRPELEHMAAALPCVRLALAPIDWSEAEDEECSSRHSAAGEPAERCGADAGTAPVPESLACLLAISCPEGPRPMEITHGTLRNLFEGVLPPLELDASSVFLASADFSLDTALFELLAPLTLGAALVLLDEEARGDPLALADLQRGSGRVVPAAPPRWRRLLETAWPGGNPCALSTGEPHGSDSRFERGGYCIAPEEIEGALEAHPSVYRALVTPGREEMNGKVPLLAWVAHAKGEHNRSARQLTEFLRVTLPAWMLPDRYLFVETLPLTPKGRKDRKALTEACLDSARVADREAKELEGEVAALFRRILEIPRIGRYDSFFDQGGNSMLAATLLLALNQRWKLDLSLKELLLSPPTVERVCRLVMRGGAPACG